MGKEEGEVAGSHCDNSSLIAMLVCLLFVSFSLCLNVRFLVSFPFKGTTLIWKEYCSTLPVCVCVCLFNVHLLHDHFCAGEDILKAIAVGLLRCHMAINSYGFE